MEYFDQVFIFMMVFGDIFEFVMVGVEGVVWGVDQCFNGFIVFQVGINQFFLQCFDNVVLVGVDFIDFVWVFVGSLNDVIGIGINNGGDIVGLSVECVFDGYFGLKFFSGLIMVQMIC